MRSGREGQPIHISSGGGGGAGANRPWTPISGGLVRGGLGVNVESDDEMRPEEGRRAVAPVDNDVPASSGAQVSWEADVEERAPARRPRSAPSSDDLVAAAQSGRVAVGRGGARSKRVAGASSKQRHLVPARAQPKKQGPR